MNFTGLTRIGIKPKSTAPEANALATRPFELLMPAIPTSSHLFSLLETKKRTHLCNVMGAIASPTNQIQPRLNNC